MQPQFNNEPACAEGWCISSIHPPMHHDEPFQLEAVANPEIGPEIFNDDEDAVSFVVAKAISGSTYHRHALQFLAEHSPRELVNFPAISSALAELAR